MAVTSKAGLDLRSLRAAHHRDVMSEIVSTVLANSLRFIRFENEPVIFGKLSKIRRRMCIAATGAQNEIFFITHLNRKAEKAAGPKRVPNAAKYPR